MICPCALLMVIEMLAQSNQKLLPLDREREHLVVGGALRYPRNEHPLPGVPAQHDLRVYCILLEPTSSCLFHNNITNQLIFSLRMCGGSPLGVREIKKLGSSSFADHPPHDQRCGTSSHSRCVVGALQSMDYSGPSCYKRTSTAMHMLPQR